MTPIARRVLSAAILLAIASTLMAQPGGPNEREPEIIAPGVARFYPFAYPMAAAANSLALQKSFHKIGDLPKSFRVTVAFAHGDTVITPPGVAAIRHSAVVPIDPGTSLYATGEIAGPLLRNGRTTICWNTDAYAYKEETPSLYQSHPWVLAVRPDGTAFGVLADTTYRCQIDLTTGIKFVADGPDEGFPVIVIDRDSPQQVLESLADLTGHMPMPPRWAIGYHQCRYSYNPESRVREIASEFRRRDIPCDVIWLDIDYMDGYRVFTFDKSQFPDPAKLNSDLHAGGYHTIWMIDPGIKAEPGYFVYDQGTAADQWVRAAGGDVYKGAVWPGQCVFPDFTRPETRQWWAGLYHDYLANGIDGVWNDMNEPAVFNVASKTMPEDNQHRGGSATNATSTADRASGPDGGGGIPALPPGPHARYHNVYGMLMASATREGIAAANPDKRPFVLTRANYIGGQRYAATWTGDNSAEWIDLENSIPMVLNLGLSGQPFAGPDIGGFNANGDADLFARWMGFGSLFPFARGHTAKGNINKEPWAFGASVEQTCKAALDRRYRLMPYFYTVFRDAALTGLPVARPLFFADTRDLALRSEDDAFLIGADVLVRAKVTPLGDRVVCMPRGVWNPLPIDPAGAPTDRALPDLFIRGGAIVPLGPAMEYTGEKPLDPLELVVSLDENGHAEGFLYEDAGDGYGYQHNEYLLSRYIADERDGIVTVRLASAEGGMPRNNRTLQVRVLVTNSEKLPATSVKAGEYEVMAKDGANVQVDVRAAK
jgi:alpha-glucosidase